MLKPGVSSSCFYPLETEIAFEKVCSIGCKYAEIFICAPSELKDDFVKGLKWTADSYGVEIIALHPFSSFMENNFLFSPYKRRFEDAVPFYERYFEVCRMFGASILTIHGAKYTGSVSDEEHFERFRLLSDRAKSFGVTLCQENVVYFKAESVDYLKKMCEGVGDNFGITLDIKQARRAEMNEFELIDELYPYIKHIHISDYNDEKDCIPPFGGKYDFNRLIAKLREKNYSGGLIIELYNHSYKEESEVSESFNRLNLLLKSHN